MVVAHNQINDITTCCHLPVVQAHAQTHPRLLRCLPMQTGTVRRPAQQLAVVSVLPAAAQATLLQAAPMAHALVVAGRQVPTPWHAQAPVAAAAVAVSRN